MLDWINALLDLFADFCVWLLDAPLYGDVRVGYVLIAMAITGILINFLIRRAR